MSNQLSNPTTAIAIDFNAFLASETRRRDAHLVDGVPDYSFSLDRELRSRISSFAPLRELARLIVHSREPYFQQQEVMRSIAVGPSQYPRIFDMGVHCAKSLGIGVPRIFIASNDVANAYTYATDDATPSIVINTRLTRGLSDQELTAIIGHECGHIHNLHMAYGTLAQLFATLAARKALSVASLAGAPGLLLHGAAALLGSGVHMFLLQWQRAAEITCDRAGAICAGGVRPMMTALAKLETGGEAELEGFDIEQLVAQLELVRRTPFKMQEFFHSHPLIPKRIAALKLFEDSEVYRAWLPTVGREAPSLSSDDLDRHCREFLRITGDPGSGLKTLA